MSATITQDFGDWMNPMLVKEFRQGLRARIFEISFIFLQALMVCCTVFMVASAGDKGDGFLSGSVFWWVNSIVFLIAMPARGLTALSSEYNGNLLELLHLTRLTSGWIILGKWMAIMAQVLLAACSVLPYALLRYFIGGVDLVSELGILLLLLVASAIFTGMCVSVSSFRSPLARIAWLVVMTFALLFFTGIFSVASGGSFFGAIILLTVIGTVFLCVVFALVSIRIDLPLYIHPFEHDY